jgi:hypothetical protein
MNLNGLKKELQDWDGKSFALLNMTYESHHRNEGFLANLIELLQFEAVQVQTTWLIKKYLESTNAVDSCESSLIWQCLPLIIKWEARLHLLQCFSFLSFTIAEKDLIEGFLRTNLGSNNKFVRAWAYSGFYQLAKQFPEYQGELSQLIENAMLGESASVKARIRNVQKLGF